MRTGEFVLYLALFFSFFAIEKYSFANENESIDLNFERARFHLIADRTLYYAKEKTYEAFGNVVLNSKNSRLSADYIRVSTQTGKVRMKGSVKYSSRLWFIVAEEMNFNMNSGHGEILFGSIVSNNYKLRGRIIKKLSKDRFLVTDGEYTFCKGCSEAWKFFAEEVDFRINSYAFMKNVSLYINNVPILYIPYLLIPVGSNRRSGFLVPKIAFDSSNGFSIIQPFFLRLGDHQDITLAYGYYGKRGVRAEFQHRYSLSESSFGESNIFYLKDKSFPYRKNRFAIHMENTWNLYKSLVIKWRLKDLSDREYVWSFPKDVGARYLPAIESNVVLNAKSDFYFFSIEAKRYRSLISSDPIKFDKNMLQTAPSLYFGTLNFPIAKRLYLGFYGRYDNFFRQGSAFDDDNENGIFDPFSGDRIREAKRLQVSPEMNYFTRISKALKLKTSLAYNKNMYWFDKQKENLKLGEYFNEYLIFNTQVSTTLERVYDFNGEKVEKIKHQISPFITYNIIPWFKESLNHPFKYQLEQDGGIFDRFDTFSLNSRRDNLNNPLKNALSYGVISRLIQKRRVPFREKIKKPKDLVSPYRQYKYIKPQNRKEELAMQELLRLEQNKPSYKAYHNAWLFSLEQAYDFSGLKGVEGLSIPFTPLLLRSKLELEKFSNYIEYQYKPYGSLSEDKKKYSSAHELKLSASWIWKKYENFHRTLFFKRSIDFSFEIVTGYIKVRNAGLGLYWSFNDYLSLHYRVAYDLLAKSNEKNSISTIYRSPSECWNLHLSYSYDREKGYSIGFDLGLSL